MRDIILAFFGSLGLSILFNVDRRKLFWAGLSGAMSWFVFTCINQNMGHVVFSTFIGAIVVGIYSEVMARIIKSPSTVFSVAGIFPLVPGLGAYNTVKYIVDNNLRDAALSAIGVIASAGAIALGIMFISGLFTINKKIKAKHMIQNHIESSSTYPPN